MPSRPITKFHIISLLIVMLAIFGFATQSSISTLTKVRGQTTTTEMFSQAHWTCSDGIITSNLNNEVCLEYGQHLEMANNDCNNCVQGNCIITSFELSNMCVSEGSTTTSQYTLFARHPFSQDHERLQIIPTTVPTANEVTAVNQLQIFAAQNDQESTSFAIHNSGTMDLLNVNVTVSNLINGNTILPADKIAVASVKVIKKRKITDWRDITNFEYIYTPEALIPYTQNYITQGEFNVPAGSSKQWWLTLKSDATVIPGTYTGQITISPENAEAKTIPLKIIVAPITLLQSEEKLSGIYLVPAHKYTNTSKTPVENINKFSYSDISPAGLAAFRQAYQEGLSLLATDIGMQTMALESKFYALYTWENGGVISNLDKFDIVFEEAKKVGLDKHSMMVYIPQVMWERIYQVILSNNPSFTDSQIKAMADTVYTQNVKDIEALRIKHGLAPFYWSVVDEPFSGIDPYGGENPVRQEELRKFGQIVKSQVPGAKIWTTIRFDNWYDDPGDTVGESGSALRAEFGPLIDIEVYNSYITMHGAPNANSYAAMLQHLRTGKTAAMYINRRIGRPLDHRLDHGLFLWNLPLVAHVPWGYQFITNDPYTDDIVILPAKNDLPERRDLADHLYVYPDFFDNGKPLPSLSLIGVREGIDDNRYIYTLQQAIKASTNSDKIVKAQNLLQEIKSTLNKEGVLPIVENISLQATPEKLDEWRVKIAGLTYDLLTYQNNIVNVLKNGNFDDTSLWNFNVPSAVTFTADGTATLVFNTTQTNVQLVQKGVSLLPNTQYQVSFIAKSSSAQVISFRLIQNGLNWTDYAVGDSQPIQLSKDWALYTAQITTHNFSEPVNDASFRLKFDTQAGGVLEFDNVILTPL